MTQVQVVAALSDVNAATRSPAVDQTASIPRVDLGDPANQIKESERLSNPAELSGEFLNGLRDLLRRSDYVNKLVGEDFLKAQARIDARESGRAVAMPGAGATAQAAMPGFSFGSTAPGMGGDLGLGIGGIGSAPSTLLPGPAGRHPGVSNPGGDGQWDQVQDLYDHAFLRYIEFSAYQLQSSELNKITEQLSSAINTLVRAS